MKARLVAASRIALVVLVTAAVLVVGPPVVVPPAAADTIALQNPSFEAGGANAAPDEWFVAEGAGPATKTTGGDHLTYFARLAPSSSTFAYRQELSLGDHDGVVGVNGRSITVTGRYRTSGGNRQVDFRVRYMKDNDSAAQECKNPTPSGATGSWTTFTLTCTIALKAYPISPYRGVDLDIYVTGTTGTVDADNITLTTGTAPAAHVVTKVAPAAPLLRNRSDNDVVMVSTRSPATAGHPEIFSMKSNGSDPTQITQSGQGNGTPAVSPVNRNVIAFTRFTEDFDGAGYQPGVDPQAVWVADIEAQLEWQLTPSWFPAGMGGVEWTPDGQWLIFGMDNGLRVELYKVRPDDYSTLTRITPAQTTSTGMCMATAPAIDHKGTTVAYQYIARMADSTCEAKSRIRTIGLDGGVNEEVVVANGGGAGGDVAGIYGDSTPRWNFDDTVIAFGRHDSGRLLSVYTAPADGSSATVLAQGTYSSQTGYYTYFVQPDWSQATDSKEVLMAEYSTGANAYEGMTRATFETSTRNRQETEETNGTAAEAAHASKFINQNLLWNGGFEAGSGDAPLAPDEWYSCSSDYLFCGSRTVTDASVDSDHITLRSTKAYFTNADVGAVVNGPGIPINDTILSVANHVATLSANANQGAVASLTIGPPAQWRTVTDGVLNNTATITSANADFTKADLGLTVKGTGIPFGTRIKLWVSEHEVQLTAAATSTSSSVTLAIGRQSGTIGRLESTANANSGDYYSYLYPFSTGTMAVRQVLDMDDVNGRTVTISGYHREPGGRRLDVRLRYSRPGGELVECADTPGVSTLWHQFSLVCDLTDHDTIFPASVASGVELQLSAITGTSGSPDAGSVELDDLSVTVSGEEPAFATGWSGRSTPETELGTPAATNTMITASTRANETNGQGIVNAEVFTIDSDGGHPTRITHEGFGTDHPVASPANPKLIAFVRYSEDFGGDGAYNFGADPQNIWMADTQGNKLWPLLPDSFQPGVGGLNWTPDGQWIVFGMDTGRFTQIWKVKPDGSYPVRVSPLGDNLCMASDVAVSSQGPWIAYRHSARRADSTCVLKGELWAMHTADGSSNLRIHDGGTDAANPPGMANGWAVGDYDPEFSPGDDKLVFSYDHRVGANDNGGVDIVKMTIGTGCQPPTQCPSLTTVFDSTAVSDSEQDVDNRPLTTGLSYSNYTLTASGGNFTSDDVGKLVTGTGIPDGTVITARADSTNVTLSKAPTDTLTSVLIGNKWNPLNHNAYFVADWSPYGGLKTDTGHEVAAERIMATQHKMDAGTLTYKGQASIDADCALPCSTVVTESGLGNVAYGGLNGNWLGGGRRNWSSLSGTGFPNNIVGAVRDDRAEDDNKFATTNSGPAGATRTFKQFGFNLPAISPFTGVAPVIVDIAVRVDWMANATTGSPHQEVRFSWDNGTNWSSSDDTDPLATTNEQDDIALASNTSNHQWGPNDVANDKLQVKVTTAGSSQSYVFSLDWVGVTVYWY